ncbi:hypothetical protein PR048_009351 [Dryococelus australis]|uniref:ubiquitinyl hydrolase 1 n=1 Tax=Dryococelus australis TaxID=614101 RepID=A0ABQ9HZM7_9NEOP|nr:hypothetical protein PR048_009351 [Dryococelus australis]
MFVLVLQVKELCALHALNNLFQERNAFSKADLDSICYSLSPDVWINPHKSFLGLGNYDVNVIMAALQQKGYEAIWFDKRKLLFSHQGEPGSIPVELPTDFHMWESCQTMPLVGGFFSGISHFPHPFIPVLLHIHLTSPSSALKTFMDPKCLKLSNIFGFILNVPSDYKLGFVMLPLRRRHWIAIREIDGIYHNLDSKLESPQLLGKASYRFRKSLYEGSHICSLSVACEHVCPLHSYIVSGMCI